MKVAHRTRNGLATVAGALLAVLLTVPAAATPPTPASGTIWDVGNIRYRWQSGSEPPAWIRPVIHAAARNASYSTRARTPEFSYDSGGTGWIGYTADIPSSYAVGYATRSLPDSFGIRLRPQGYQLDWGTLRWCQFYESPPNGCYDAELITLHEFGHVLTLGHIDETTVTDWLDTIMHAAPKTRAKVGWNEHQFGRCDVARLQVRYEFASPSTLGSTCLDLATGLSLSALPSGSVDYGSTVNFVAALEIDQGAEYAALAGDPLAGRTVWLQRRPIGGSAWTDLSQMTAQSASPGRYGRALAVYGSFEYRASFAAPGNEGLRGSTSGILRIYVGDPCVNTDEASSAINVPTC